MQNQQPTSSATPVPPGAQPAAQEPQKKPAIRVRTHIRAGDRLFDSQNSDIRLKTGVETLSGVLTKLARVEIDLSDE